MRDILKLATVAGTITGEALYQVQGVFNDYDSCIWSERYQPAGDFKLVFKNNIDDRYDDFPEDTLLGLVDSTEIMIVEDRVVDDDSLGETTLTITGRTFETFFEGRIARPIDPKKTGFSAWPLNTSTTNATTKEVKDVQNDWALNRTSAASAKYIMDYWTTATNSQYYNMKVPNYKIVVDAPGLASRSVVIAPGQVYERVLELLAIDDLGIKNSRPMDSSNSGNIVTTIYRGRDVSDAVVFSYAAGHFKKASYGNSNKGTKNWSWNFSFNDFNVSFGGKYSTWSGRAGYNEMSDVKLNPDFLDNHDATWDLYDTMLSRGDAYLNDNKYTNIFGCDLSDSVPFKYGVDYLLGDLVRAQGRFGTDQKMRLSEHIRVSDLTGDYEYSTLTALTDLTP